MKTRGRLLRDARARQQIPGELEHAEAVERHVVVDRRDHPVAIDVGEGPGAILLVAVAVRVTREVQPVTAPAFAEMRRAQQPIYQPLIRIRPRVGHELAYLLGLGRQPEQIQAQPPDQRVAVRLGRRRDFLLRQPREHKRINRILNFEL